MHFSKQCVYIMEIAFPKLRLKITLFNLFQAVLLGLVYWKDRRREQTKLATTKARTYTIYKLTYIYI